MLRLLSINNPALILASIFASFSIHLIYFFSGKIEYSFVLNYQEPLSQFLFSHLAETGNLFFPLVLFLGALFQIIAAVFLNLIINEFKISSKRAYLAAFIFVLISSLNPQWLILSPQLIAITLWILMFYRIMILSKQEKFYSVLFDIGFLSSLSVFFYLPSAYFLIFIFPALFSVRPYQFKEFMRVIFGLFTPLYIVLAIYFLNDKLPNFAHDFLNSQNLNRVNLDYFNKNFSPFIYIIAVWSIISVFTFALIPVSLSLKTRNVSTLLIFHTVLTMLFFFIPTHFHIAYLVLLSPMIAIYLSLFFLDYKGSFLPNVIFALLCLSALIPLIL